MTPHPLALHSLGVRGLDQCPVFKGLDDSSMFSTWCWADCFSCLLLIGTGLSVNDRAAGYMLAVCTHITASCLVLS